MTDLVTKRRWPEEYSRAALFIAANLRRGEGEPTRSEFDGRLQSGGRPRIAASRLIVALKCRAIARIGFTSRISGGPMIPVGVTRVSAAQQRTRAHPFTCSRVTEAERE
jgi:hypothetical protein